MAATSPPTHLRRPHTNHTSWVLRRVWERVNERNEHFMGVIVGEEGSGKSYTALKIADAIDPGFTADRVIFDVLDLLKVLNSGDHEPGQFYVLDEAGVQLGNRTWQERGQVLANQALQLIRSHNLGLIFTLPRLGELDSQAQGRMQAFLEMTEKEDGDFVKCKWKRLDPDRADESGKIYKKYPVRYINGQRVRVTRMGFSPPPDEIVEPYEERKHEFQQEFYQKTIDQLEDIDEEEEQQKSPREIATEIATDGIRRVISEHGHTGAAYINKDLLRAEFELSHSDASAIKALLDDQFSSDELEEIRMDE